MMSKFTIGRVSKNLPYNAKIANHATNQIPSLKNHRTKQYLGHGIMGEKFPLAIVLCHYSNGISDIFQFDSYS